MTGNVAPVIENPAPVTLAELTVTGAVPEELSVNVWGEVAFKFTLPKPSALALNVSWGDAFALEVAGTTSQILRL